jgi:predicted aspartyl protease
LKNVSFSDTAFYKLERRDGLFYVTLHTIYKDSPAEGAELKLILDTGAYMTVLSRGTAIRHGFDELPKKPTTLTGFGGSVDADFVRIPGLLVLGRLRLDIPVLIPHDMFYIDNKTGKRRQMQEVLGLNVLEYYNYFIDTENDRLYLQENPNPRFYRDELASGQVFVSAADSPQDDTCGNNI